MAQIPAVDARALFTKMLIAVYKERPIPTAFLRSFFRNRVTNTKEISIQVQRGTEKIAVDVERGTEGNRNKFDRSTEKIFVPPYYKEFFDATDLDMYDMIFTTSGEIDGDTFSQWLRDVAEKIATLQAKIERAYELQCSQVLQTGVVLLNTGDQIDFKRRPESLVDLAADYWSTNTVNPLVAIQKGGAFIRKYGKAQGVNYNMILGSEAYSALINNPVYQEVADNRRIDLTVIREPQRESTGGSLHGEVAGGSYRFRIWTYEEFYDTKTTQHNPYIDPKNMIIIPEAPNFELGFSGVPQLISSVGRGTASNVAGRRGGFVVSEYEDQRNKAHIMNVESAGLAIPTAVDQIYTQKVVA